MLELNYTGEKTKHKVDFDIVNDHVIKVIGTLPAKTKGFTLSREGEEDGWDYAGFTTVYQQGEGVVLFSDDGSVYAKPLPKIDFYTAAGGLLVGEVNQEAGRYEELTVPAVEVEENYEFTGWMPEIPLEGEIEADQTFTAQVQYIPTLAEVKERKVEEMNRVQQSLIQRGVEVQLSNGTKERFTLTVNDQLSLLGLSAGAGEGHPQIHWHEANENKHCEYYTPEDMLAINTAALSFVAYQVTYFRSLRIYIRSLQTKEEVEAVTYGMMIPEAYQGQVLKDMLAGMAGEGVRG